LTTARLQMTALSQWSAVTQTTQFTTLPLARGVALSWQLYNVTAFVICRL